jgi:hypothetical protein
MNFFATQLLVIFKIIVSISNQSCDYQYWINLNFGKCVCFQFRKLHVFTTIRPKSVICRVEIHTPNDCVMATVQNSHTKCYAIPLKAGSMIIICVSDI